VLLLSACGGGGDSGPSMSVSPTSITFTAVQNGATPASQNVSVSISGGTVVAQIKSITGTGFSVSLGIAGETTGIITVTPFAPTMAPGTYTGTITVRGCPDNFCVGGDVSGSPAVINVSYTIQPPVGLAASPRSLAFTQLQGGPAPTSQSLGISDLRGGTYAWSATIFYQSGSGWLNINGASSASGTTLPTSLTLSINPSATLGTLNALVRFAGNGFTLDVPVSYTVTQPPITPAPSSLTFGAPRLVSPPATQDVALTTASGLPVAFTTEVTYGFDASGWLSVPASGAAPGSMTVRVNTTNLSPGIYNATLTVRTATQMIPVPVSYTVREPIVTPSPAQLTFNAIRQGTLPAAQNVVLATEQDLSLAYRVSVSYGSSASGWLNPPEDGTAPGTVSVGVNTSNLAPGTHTATLTFRTPNQLIAVGVTYVVEAQFLTFTPTPATFTISTTSPASSLSQKVAVGSTTVPLTWTNAVSSQPWVTVAPTTGSSGNPVTLSLDPALLETLDPGTYSATITLSYTPPSRAPTTAPLSVSLNLQIPKVDSVNPYIATSGASLEVILRGSGFSNPGAANVNFGGSAPATGTVISDTELRVTHPALAAGTYRVNAPNQLGNLAIIRSTADLVVVNAPVYAATTITYPAIPAGIVRVPRKIIYDAERRALIVHMTYMNSAEFPNGFPTGREIQRYAFDGSTWSTTPTVVTLGSVFGSMAATLDGKRLLVTSGTAIQEYDMGTLAVGTSTSVDLGFSPVFLDQLAIANDGNALVAFSEGGGLGGALRFSVPRRTFALDSLAFLNAASSADGSLLVFASGSPIIDVYVYNASTSSLSARAGFNNVRFPFLDRRGTRILFGGPGGFTVYDRDFQQLGTTFGLINSEVLSPDGLRAYALNRIAPDGNTIIPTVLRAYDLSQAALGGQFPEIGNGTPLPSDPVPLQVFDAYLMTVSPDGGTVFIAGSDGIVVVPAP